MSAVMKDSPPLPYSPQLPWIVSVLVTVVSMGFDHQPEARYSTGHDPGGAAVVSIAFGLWCGWLTLLAMAGPRWLRLGLVVLVPSSFFGYALNKNALQWLLYVRNADIMDPLVLWGVGGLIAAASVWLTRSWLRLLTVLVSIPLALAASIGVRIAAVEIAYQRPAWPAEDSWNPAWPEFVFLAACRVLVPYVFWKLLLPKSLLGCSESGGRPFAGVSDSAAPAIGH